MNEVPRGQDRVKECERWKNGAKEVARGQDVIFSFLGQDWSVPVEKQDCLTTQLFIESDALNKQSQLRGDAPDDWKNNSLNWNLYVIGNF